MADSLEKKTLNFIDLVKFRVGFGNEEKEFMIHKAFACDASPVLKAAFNSRFQEGETQTYILEDVDAEIFDRLVLWIYTKTVGFKLVNGVEMELPSKEIQANFDEEVMRLMKLWVMGDKLLMPQLQNKVLAAITRMWTFGQCHSKSTSWIPYIWNHTIVGSPIRRFVRAHVIRWVEKAHGVQQYKDFPQELLMDVLISPQEISVILDKKAETMRLWTSLKTESEWEVPEDWTLCRHAPAWT